MAEPAVQRLAVRHRDKDRSARREEAEVLAQDQAWVIDMFENETHRDVVVARVGVELLEPAFDDVDPRQRKATAEALDHLGRAVDYTVGREVLGEVGGSKAVPEA